MSLRHRVANINNAVNYGTKEFSESHLVELKKMFNISKGTASIIKSEIRMDISKYKEIKDRLEFINRLFITYNMDSIEQELFFRKNPLIVLQDKHELEEKMAILNAFSQDEEVFKNYSRFLNNGSSNRKELYSMLEFCSIWGKKDELIKKEVGEILSIISSKEESDIRRVKKSMYFYPLNKGKLDEMLINFNNKIYDALLDDLENKSLILFGGGKHE